jgi:hypothetical protein
MSSAAVHPTAFAVEDHTHDPWSEYAASSTADLCMASLRKTLPVSDGAVLWSPRGHALPEQPPMSEQMRIAVKIRRRAMELKYLYLLGKRVAKPDFLHLFEESEKLFSDPRPSACSEAARTQIDEFPAHEWRRQRSENFISLAEQCEGLGCQIWKPREAATVPYAAIVAFSTREERDRSRAALIARDIYPAVLWDLPGDRGAASVLASRSFALHCDGRYRAADLRRVTSELSQVVAVSK